MGMARFIDAKALEKQIKEAFEDTNPFLMGQMLRWVRKQTTIDAVPVVRCKDCKNYFYSSVSMGMRCRLDGTEWEKDDFCSCGERKDNAGLL